MTTPENRQLKEFEFLVVKARKHDSIGKFDARNLDLAIEDLGCIVLTRSINETLTFCAQEQLSDTFAFAGVRVVRISGKDEKPMLPVIEWLVQKFRNNVRFAKLLRFEAQPAYVHFHRSRVAPPNGWRLSCGGRMILGCTTETSLSTLGFKRK